MNSGQGIEQAQEKFDAIKTQLEDLKIELEGQLSTISGRYDVMKDNMIETEVRPTTTNTTIHLVGLAWVPKD
ncbi:MAG TPA: hypothetical protein DCS67_08485 [Clostridiales bacterium UBA8960]|jgi:uncharacterized protein with GYD domain|nr:hypothetical protein [Clostridiales bacterium UBA8960]